MEVENGYYDLATPFFATEFTMDHLSLPAALQDHVHEILRVRPHDVPERLRAGCSCTTTSRRSSIAAQNSKN